MGSGTLVLHLSQVWIFYCEEGFCKRKVEKMVKLVWEGEVSQFLVDYQIVDVRSEGVKLSVGKCLLWDVKSRWNGRFWLTAGRTTVVWNFAAWQDFFVKLSCWGKNIPTVWCERSLYCVVKRDFTGLKRDLAVVTMDLAGREALFVLKVLAGWQWTRS